MQNKPKFNISILTDYSNFENNLYQILPLLPISNVGLKIFKSIYDVEDIINENKANVIVINKASYTNEEVLYLSNIDYKDISEIIMIDSYYKHETLFLNYDKGFTVVRRPLSINKFLEILKNSIHGSIKKKKNGNNINKIKAIEMAKALLIEYENMFEEDAHKYLEKISMDSGKTLYDESLSIITKYLYEKENIKYEHKD